MEHSTFLVTGALGCIGSWVLKNLVSTPHRVIASDFSSDLSRPRLLLSERELSRITFLRADLTDHRNLESTVERFSVTHIIHLAGLQVPFCQRDPRQGAAVNVVGTINVLECARRFPEQVRGLVYASSIAVLGPSGKYSELPVGEDARPFPTTLYGAYKQANEESARIYFDDWGVSSIGLRPSVVYGVGRDQGLTSDLAKALLATAAGRPYQIKFSGPVSLQYADDVARIFIQAAQSGHRGAAICNLRNDVLTVQEFVGEIHRIWPAARISFQAGKSLPFPADLDDSVLRSILRDVPHRPLEEAMRETVEHFGRLLEAGQIDLGQLS